MPKSRLELTVIGNEEELHAFLRVCLWIQYCGKAGTNQGKRIVVDGDGSGHLQFSINGEQLEGPISEEPTMWIGE